MEGVTILKETPVYQQIMPEFPGFIIYIALTAGFAIGAIIGLIMTCKKGLWSTRWKSALGFTMYIMSFIGMIGLLAGVIISGIAYRSDEVKTGEFLYTTYEVTVDENVQVSDFFERYHVDEIISQENLVFAVREKTCADVEIQEVALEVPLIGNSMVSVMIIFGLIACAFALSECDICKKKKRKTNY